MIKQLRVGNFMQFVVWEVFPGYKLKQFVSDKVICSVLAHSSKQSLLVTGLSSQGALLLFDDFRIDTCIAVCVAFIFRHFDLF